MKHRLISIFAIVTLTLSAMAQTWTAPTEPTRPTAVDYEVGNSYYIMNVGSGQFVTAANSWATTISLSSDCMPNMKFLIEDANDGSENDVRIKVDGYYTTYGDHGFESGRRVGNDYVFRDSEGYAYIDCNGRGKNIWTFTKAESGYYYWQSAEGQDGIDYDVHMQYAAGQAAGTPVDFTASINDAYIEWAFIPIDIDIDAYKNYASAFTVYNARHRLYNLYLDAVKYGADITTATAVYNNNASTVEELDAAYGKLLKAMPNAVMAYAVSHGTADAPVVMPYVISNADFSKGDISGWTIDKEGYAAQIMGYQGASYTGLDESCVIQGFVEAWKPAPNHLGNLQIYQTISGLPNGHYILECDALALHQSGVNDTDNYIEKSQYTGTYLFCSDGTITMKSVALASDREETEDKYGNHISIWHPAHFVFEFNITTAAKSVKLGIMTDNTNLSWIAADNFVLKYAGEPQIASVLNYAFDDANHTATVIALEDGKYEGVIVIPETVEHNGETFTVTGIDDGAFRRCWDVTSVTIPNSVTSIGKNAFSECEGLTSITIPASVTSIGKKCFAWCDGLESISVDADNTVYDSRSNCNALIVTATNTLILGCKNSFIPDGVTTIDVQAFASCGGLKEIAIPASVTSIGEEAFYNCSNITTLTFVDGVTTINDEAFKYCTGLTTLTIPNSVTTIGEEAFFGCEGLTTITLGSGVTTIGDEAFYGCTGFKDVYCLNESVPTTTDRLFAEINLANVTLHVPDAAINEYEAKVPWNQFGRIVAVGSEEMTVPEYQDGDEFTALIDDGVEMTFTVLCAADKTCQIKEMSWSSRKLRGRLTLPSMINGLHVVSIDIWALSDCQADEIIIPEGIKSIGASSFAYCNNITRIELPASMEYVNGGGFSSCRNLDVIEINSSNPVLSSRGCNVIIDNNTNVVLGGCRKSRFPEGVVGIGDNAFDRCVFESTPEWPTTLRTIGEYAFHDCQGLSSLVLPEGLESVEFYSFNSCDIQSLYIPSTFKSIGAGYAFGDNPDLHEIEVAEANTVFDSRNNCNAIIVTATNKLVQGSSTTIIPDGVQSLGWGAFTGLTSLKELMIPEGVTDLGDYTFYHCRALETISIPSSVTTIWKTTFYDCDNLKSIYCYITEPFALDCQYSGPFGRNGSNDDEINKTYQQATLYVPAGTKALYEATEGWNKFQNIVEMEGETIVNENIPTDGLVAYYPFNGNANDESGHGNDGTPMDNVTLTTGVHGEANGAYRFGGPDNPGNIHIPNSESLQIGDGWSFAAYVKPLSIGGMWGSGAVEDFGSFCIMGKSHDRHGVSLKYEYPQEESFRVKFGAWGWDEVDVKDDNVSHLGQWTHVAVTKSGNHYKVFINGKMMSEIETEHDYSIANSQDLYLGKYDDFWYPMNGIMDEVCIYNRALTADEVRQMAQYAEDELISTDIAIDATNFPDENFRNYLLEQDYGQDGKLTEEEIAEITSMYVYGSEIEDLTGIGVFTSLRYLDCGWNQLTSLDVSNNTALESLECYDNQLTSLDLSNNTALTYLHCGTNQLTSLDVSKNTGLQNLYCWNNQLTALDVSQNTALTLLDCGTNTYASLDLSNNTELQSLNCYNSQLPALDVSKNTKLTSLICSGNALTALDVSNNTELTELYCQANQIKALDLSHNTSLQRFNAHANQLTSLIVSPEMPLKLISCYVNQIKEEAMDALIASLPTVDSGTFYVLYPDEEEGNVCTPEQASAAWQKGWNILKWDDELDAWKSMLTITWTKVATGTYYYDLFSGNTDGELDPEPGYELYVCDIRPNYYQILDWLFGTAFLFTWDHTTNACSVLKQYINYDHPTYGQMYIIEGAKYSSRYEEYTSYYDPETKIFHFFPVYYVEAGSFGQYEELFEITDDGDVPVAINGIPSKNHLTIYNISGQRLSKPQHGVNIINGKKVVIK